MKFLEKHERSGCTTTFVTWATLALILQGSEQLGIIHSTERIRGFYTSDRWQGLYICLDYRND